MHVLHSHDIVHRDLRPENVLLNSRCEIQLVGLDKAMILQNGERALLIIAGLHKHHDSLNMRWYRPPELLLGCQKVTKKEDIWSLGCILGEMLFGKAVFPGANTTN